MKSKYRKLKSWLFRDNLELNKKWWHRLLKVLFLVFFIVPMITTWVLFLIEPERYFFRLHNISINNSLYSFTNDYKGEGYQNTIQDFFKQNGMFGVIKNGSIEYISFYSLNKSFCLRDPEKYLNEISQALYSSYINDTLYGYKNTKAFTIDEVKEEVYKNYYADTSRRCYFIGIDKYDDLSGIDNLSINIINYKPNSFYYLELTVIIILSAIILFLLSALIYYRVILYVVYGNKK